MLGDLIQYLGEKIFSPRQFGVNVYIRKVMLKLQDLYNDHDVRIVSFAISKPQVVESMMFPHRGIHKFT
jgi:hypothetical protein